MAACHFLVAVHRVRVCGWRGCTGMWWRIRRSCQRPTCPRRRRVGEPIVATWALCERCRHCTRAGRGSSQPRDTGDLQARSVATHPSSSQLRRDKLLELDGILSWAAVVHGRRDTSVHAGTRCTGRACITSMHRVIRQVRGG